MSEPDARAVAEMAQAVTLLVSASAERGDPDAIEQRRAVVELTVAMADPLGLDAADAEHYATIAGLGVGAVGADLREQDATLTEPERARLCEGPAASAALAATLAATRPLADALRAAHERWDGTGYPDGLRGEQIPPLARAYAVADAWVALRRDRPYRPALSAAAAAEVVRRNAGTQFCPHAAEVLLELVAEELPAPPVAVPEPRRTAPRRTAPRRTPLAAQFVVAAVGVAVGLYFALPLKDVHDRCPPSGEGLVQCQLQKSVLPAVTIVLGCMIGALILFWLVTRGLPDAYRWWRRGGRRPRREVDVAADPVLLAANWGLTYRDAHPEARVRRGRSWKALTS
jgi:hypothetical protein